jgi:hypothetical protein
LCRCLQYIFIRFTTSIVLSHHLSSSFLEQFEIMLFHFQIWKQNTPTIYSLLHLFLMLFYLQKYDGSFESWVDIHKSENWTPANYSKEITISFKDNQSALFCRKVRSFSFSSILLFFKYYLQLICKLDAITILLKCESLIWPEKLQVWVNLQ